MIKLKITQWRLIKKSQYLQGSHVAITLFLFCKCNNSTICCICRPHNEEVKWWQYLAFWPDKAREIYTAENGNSLVFQHFLTRHSLVTHSWTQKQVTWHSCLLQSASYLYPVHTKWMACRQCWNNITSLALSSVKLSWLCPTIKGSDSLQSIFKKCFLRDFRTMFIGGQIIYQNKSKWDPTLVGRCINYIGNQI
jgi:hypothetical protein